MGHGSGRGGYGAASRGAAAAVLAAWFRRGVGPTAQLFCWVSWHAAILNTHAGRNTPILHAILSPISANTQALNPTLTILNTQHHHYTPILYAILKTPFEYLQPREEEQEEEQEEALKEGHQEGVQEGQDQGRVQGREEALQIQQKEEQMRAEVNRNHSFRPAQKVCQALQRLRRALAMQKKVSQALRRFRRAVAMQKVSQGRVRTAGLLRVKQTSSLSERGAHSITN